MKISRFVSLVAFVTMTLGLAGAQPAEKPAAPAPKLPVLGHAPAWKIKDLNGNDVSFSQFKGKVVVIDFWATWCEPCRMEIPGYVELQKKYGKDGLVIVGISVDQGPVEAVKKFVESHGMNYIIGMVNDETLAAFGGIEVYPTTFLVDRAGEVRDGKLGVEDKATYEQKVLALLR